MKRAPRLKTLLARVLAVALLASSAACSNSAVTDAPASPGQANGNPPNPEVQGRWHPIASDSPHLDPRQREALERLQALPYLQGSQPAPAGVGVTVFEPGRAQPGLNLYNSGHGPEAFLTDMEGKVLHRWAYPIGRIWPEAGVGHQSTYWRRVEWLPNGDILAIFEGTGLIRLDFDSRLKWAYRDAVHHVAIEAEDGTIWTLTRKNALIPRINPDQPVWEDFLVQLSREGKPLREISLLKAFERSPYRRMLDGMKHEGDIFHTNSIVFLDGRHSRLAPWMRRGNVLLSAFFLDTIFAVDLDRESVVWAMRGDGAPSFKGQHDPRFLDDGHLLLFDNWGRSGRSKVIEFDPISRAVFWQYPPPEGDLRTPTCGTAQRLANGDTLITESDRGHALEVTSQGEIVWEFWNPHRAGDRLELIATLFEMRRVDPNYFH